MTRNFTHIRQLKLFSNPFWVLTRNKSSKVECFFFDCKYIRVEHINHFIIMKIWNHNLFFKYQIEVWSIDSWNTTFCHDFITITLRILFWVSFCDINSKLLDVRLGSLSCKFDSYIYTLTRFYLFSLWENLPLTNFQSIHITFLFLILFLLFLFFLRWSCFLLLFLFSFLTFLFNFLFCFYFFNILSMLFF